MKTTREPPASKARLLDAAERLMQAQGFSATSVEEICEAAKLTKGSFFHYFESKEQLGQELLERFCGTMQARFREAVSGERDPLKRVYACVDFVIEMSKECGARQGCLLGGFAQELSDTHPAMRSLCAKAFTEWAGALKQDLDEAKARYAPRAALDTRSLAEHFIAVLEGAKILAKAKGDHGIEEQSLRHFKRYLQSLFGKSPRRGNLPVSLIRARLRLVPRRGSGS
jgi:TetR/AcrR family transcriptional repressor of nem operon